MMQGIDEVTAGVVFIGYHARAGSPCAVLAHTWSSGRISNVWINEMLVGEYGLNGALAGHFHVPVLMITGDQTTCSQAIELFGPLETVVVKVASGYFSAECYSPKETLPKIRETARKAVLRIKDRSAPQPFVVSLPVKLTIEFRQPEFVDRAVRLPGVKRLDGLKIEFTFQTMLDAHTGFRAAVKQSYD